MNLNKMAESTANWYGEVKPVRVEATVRTIGDVVYDTLLKSALKFDPEHVGKLSYEERSELKKNAIRIPSELFGSFHSCLRSIYDCAKQGYSVYMDNHSLGTKVYSVDVKDLDDAYRIFLGDTEKEYEERKYFFQVGKATISDPLKQENWENFVFEMHNLDEVGGTLALLEMINKDGKDWSKINKVYYEISDLCCLLPFDWFKLKLKTFSNNPNEVDVNLVDLHNY